MPKVATHQPSYQTVLHDRAFTDATLHALLTAIHIFIVHLSPPLPLTCGCPLLPKVAWLLQLASVYQCNMGEERGKEGQQGNWHN